MDEVPYHRTNRGLYITERRLRTEILRSETIVRRFPSGHSCRNCEEKVANLVRSQSHFPIYIGDVDNAIIAARHGCLLFEWLLDFWILSYASSLPWEQRKGERWLTELMSREGFYLERHTISEKICNFGSLSFLIGTTSYKWPCASFDVFAEQGEYPNIPRAAQSLTCTGDPADRHVLTETFQREVGSDESFRFVQNCLSTCCSTHPGCFGSKRDFLPSRLLELFVEEDTSLVRLVATQSISVLPTPSFATLSDVWGSNQNHKTTVSNLHAHETGMKMSDLGQTLQDAILVSRTLGIKFLWVDSLCIVQDSPIEMATEISRMMDYYENCFICIFAASAGSSEGFLKNRVNNTYKSGPFGLPISEPGRLTGSINLATYGGYQNSMDPADERTWIL